MSTIHKNIHQELQNWQERRFFGIFRVEGYMWGLLAGEACQQTPHLPVTTATPNDPERIWLNRTIVLL